MFAETIDAAFGTKDDRRAWDPDYDVAVSVVTSNPVRGAEHQEALRRALASGVISHVASDHTAFSLAQKQGGRGDFRYGTYAVYVAL